MADVPTQSPSAWVPLGSAAGDGADAGVEIGEPGRGAPGPAAALAVARPLAVHPMSLPDILDGAFTLFKANARSLVLLTALFVVPIQLVTAYLSRDVLGGVGLADALTNASLSGMTVTSGPGSTVALLVTLATSALVLPVMVGALCRVAASSYLGTPLPPGVALRGALRRWPTFVGAWILVHLIEGAASVAVLLPALAAMALCTAVAPIVAVEGLGAGRAVGRSFRLVGSRLFPVLGVVLATVALSSALSVALGIVPEVAALVIGYERGWVLAATGSTLGALITQPLVACIATLVYIDGRIRQEGLDIALLVEDLAPRAGRG